MSFQPSPLQLVSEVIVCYSSQSCKCKYCAYRRILRKISHILCIIVMYPDIRSTENLCSKFRLRKYMWQSRVEIESYSVGYFDRITSYKTHVSPALNRSSATWRFEGSDAIEIRDRITFDFYMGPSHIKIPKLSLILYSIFPAWLLN